MLGLKLDKLKQEEQSLLETCEKWTPKKQSSKSVKKLKEEKESLQKLVEDRRQRQVSAT